MSDSLDEERPGRARAPRRPREGPSRDRSADAATLLLHADAVKDFCRSRLASPEEVEDAVQDTYVRFLERPAGEIRDPEAWLIGVARRACHKVIRERRGGGREQALPDTLPARAGGRFEDAVLTANLVQTVFANLGPRDVEVLTRLYLAGCTVDEVAKDLGKGGAHIRVIALRARRRARVLLEGIGVTGASVGLLGWLQEVVQSGRRAARSVGYRLGELRRGIASTDDQLTAPGYALTNSVAVIAVGVAVVTSSVLAPQALAPPTGGTPSVSFARSRTAVPPTDGSAGGNSTAAVLDPRSRSGPFGPDAPTPSGPGGAVSWVAGSVASNQNPQPQDTQFTSFTASPDYSQDHTVYASGEQVSGCPGVCAVLFVSRDGAASWQALAAGGFVGGQVLLSPAYPADPTLFAVGPSGLQRSSDGGTTFATVVPRATRAAMRPGEPAGQASILLGTVPLLVYSEATGLVAPGPALPAGVGTVDALTYVSDGQHAVIAGERVDPAASGQIDGVLATCDAQQCVETAAYPGLRPTGVAASPTERVDHTSIATFATALLITRDAGATWAAAALPSADDPGSVAMDPHYAATSRMFVGATPGTPTHSNLLISHDGGRSFSEVSPSGLPATYLISALTLLPDGRALLGLVPTLGSGFPGVRCSGDDGASWRSACP